MGRYKKVMGIMYKKINKYYSLEQHNCMKMLIISN